MFAIAALAIGQTAELPELQPTDFRIALGSVEVYRDQADAGQAPPVIIHPFEIGRVVGDETAYDSSGRLLDPTGLRNAGVITSARLRFTVSDGIGYHQLPFLPMVFHLKINGVPIAAIQTINGVKDVNVEVPISALKFAQRRPKTGLAPLPGQNELRVEVDASSILRLQLPGNPYFYGFDVKVLNFRPFLEIKAMYPTIMIHGSGDLESGLWFEGIRPPSSPSFSDPLTEAFKAVKAPYDRTICLHDVNNLLGGASSESQIQNADCFGNTSINGLAFVHPASPDFDLRWNSIGIHGGELEVRVPRILKEFGVKHGHLVTHSAGGLWARDYAHRLLHEMRNTGEVESALLSLTTVSAVHKGSALSDIAHFLHQYPSQQGAPTDLSANQFDLCIECVANFNRTNQVPTWLTTDGITWPVAYGTLGSDADRNFNLTIDVFEALGLENWGTNTFPYLLQANLAYTLLRSGVLVSSSGSSLYGEQLAAFNMLPGGPMTA